MYIGGTLWRVIQYTKATGSPVTQNVEVLGYVNASAVASIDLTSMMDNTLYSSYDLEIQDIKPVNNNQTLNMRVSTTNGLTWEIGGSDYDYMGMSYVQGNFFYAGSGGNSQVGLQDGVGNGSNQATWARVHFYEMSTSEYKAFDWKTFCRQSGGNLFGYNMWGSYRKASAVDAIQLYFSSGNIASGVAILRGNR
jgi:hypothetical protein